MFFFGSFSNITAVRGVCDNGSHGDEDDVPFGHDFDCANAGVFLARAPSLARVLALAPACGEHGRHAGKVQHQATLVDERWNEAGLPRWVQKEEHTQLEESFHEAVSRHERRTKSQQQQLFLSLLLLRRVSGRESMLTLN